MASDLLIYGAIATAATTTLAVGFSLPALTVGSSGGTRDEVFQAVVQEERRYCQTALQDVDCLCFASRSGYVIEQDRPRAQGYWYPERVDFARRQAVSACRR